VPPPPKKDFHGNRIITHQPPKKFYVTMQVLRYPPSPLHVHAESRRWFTNEQKVTVIKDLVKELFERAARANNTQQTEALKAMMAELKAARAAGTLRNVPSELLRRAEAIVGQASLKDALDTVVCRFTTPTTSSEVAAATSTAAAAEAQEASEVADAAAWMAKTMNFELHLPSPVGVEHIGTTTIPALPTEANPNKRKTRDDDEDDNSLVVNPTGCGGGVFFSSSSDTQLKRLRFMSSAIAQQFMCCISQELMVDPVLAEDGNTCVQIGDEDAINHDFRA